MRQAIQGIPYDTQTLSPLHLWHNYCPPDHPQYQRYIVYRAAVDFYVVWVKTGSRRGGLNQLIGLSRVQLDTLYQSTVRQDRRRSLARVVAPWLSPTA